MTLPKNINLSNKVHCNSLLEAIEKALGSVHPDLNIKYAGGSIMSGGLKIKIEITMKGAPPLQQQEAARYLEHMAEIHGLDIDKIDADGNRLVGYNAKGRVRPWLVKKPDGHIWNWGDSLVQRSFAKGQLKTAKEITVRRMVSEIIEKTK